MYRHVSYFSSSLEETKSHEFIIRHLLNQVLIVNIHFQIKTCNCGSLKRSLWSLRWIVTVAVPVISGIRGRGGGVIWNQNEEVKFHSVGPSQSKRQPCTTRIRTDVFIELGRSHWPPNHRNMRFPHFGAKRWTIIVMIAARKISAIFLHKIWVVEISGAQEFSVVVSKLKKKKDCIFLIKVKMSDDRSVHQFITKSISCIQKFTGSFYRYPSWMSLKIKTIIWKLGR